MDQKIHTALGVVAGVGFEPTYVQIMSLLSLRYSTPHAIELALGHNQDLEAITTIARPVRLGEAGAILVFDERRDHTTPFPL